MNKDEIERIMQFVRIDGPATAPVCFLTIEDGGELEERGFDNYIRSNQIWIPTEDERPLNYKKTGAPGEFISKIMTYAFGDLFDITDWQVYRAKSLYSRNEHGLSEMAANLESMISLTNWPWIKNINLNAT